MATVRLSPLFNGWQGFGSTGLPLNGGLIYTYQAGTSTPAATYTTNAGSVQNANPIVLAADGRPPQEIWLVEGTTYKLVLNDNLGNLLGTYDNITGIGDLSTTNIWTGTNTFNNTVTLATNLVFSGNARRITGDFSNATIANRVLFQSSTLNGNTDLVAIPNGASTQSSFNVFNGTDPANAAFGHIAISNGEFSIQSFKTGAGVQVPFTFYCGSTEAMRLSIPNNQLLINTATESAVTGAKLRVNGIVQIDNACAFSANRNNVGQAIANTTFTQVAFTTEDFDQNNNFNTGTSRFTPPAGKYFLTASAGFTGAVDQQRMLVLIYKNGAVFKAANFSASGVNAINAQCNAVVDANGTDFFEVFCWQNSGGAQTISGTTTDTYFMGYRIG